MSGLNAVLNPVDTFRAALSGLSNFSVSDIRDQPTTTVAGEGQAPAGDSLIPSQPLHVVVDAIAGSVPSVGSMTPRERPQSVVSAVAERVGVSSLLPGQTPTAPVQGEATPPASESLLLDAPTTVVDAIAGRTPDPSSLVPGGAGQRIQTTVDGVVGQLGLSDKADAAASMLSPAESAAGRIAGRLHGAGRSVASAITGAHPPGMDASIQVGDAPSQVPVDASAVPATISTDQTEQQPQHVGNAIAALAQRTAPSTTQSPDSPINPPGIGGGGAQTATVGAAVAESPIYDADAPAETVVEATGYRFRSE